MADSTPPNHPLSEVNIDALETQKFDLPSGLVQRSNSIKSTRSDKSVSSTSTSTSIDNSRVSSPVQPSHNKPTTPPPSFIVLSLWPHATDSQIASYVQGYEDLYPSASVLLLRSSRLASSSRSPDLESVTHTLTSSLEEHQTEKSTWPSSPSTSTSTSSTVLLHLFGHTGALNACTLLHAYRARTTTPLPVHAIVSDTSPSLTLTTLPTHLSSPSHALTLLTTLLLTLLTAALSLLTSSSAATHRIRADLTNPALLPAGVRKCFVFAAQEMMFSWCEGSKGIAERREWRVKRTGVDAGGRWSGEKERYWLGIEGVWEGGC